LRKIVQRGRFDGDVIHWKEAICHTRGAAGREFSRMRSAERGIEPLPDAGGG
jgi:hypothetical protein